MKLQRLFILTLIFVFGALAVMPVRAQDDTATTTFYITEDGAFSAKLPEGWYATGDVSGLQIANNEAMLTNDDFDITGSGDLGLSITPIAKADLESLGLATDATIFEIATAIAPNIADEDTTVGEPESLGDTVARITVSDATHDGVIYVGDNLAPDFLGLAILVAPKDELTDDAEAELLGLIPGINYGLVLEQSFTSADETITFDYPADWVVNDAGNGIVQIADSQPTLDGMMVNDPVAAGESRIALVGVAQASVPTDLSADSLKGLAVQAVTSLVGGEQNGVTLGEPEVLENEALTGGSVIYLSFTGESGEGGLFLVNNAGVVHITFYSGVPGEALGLYGTALGIANSATFTLPQ